MRSDGITGSQSQSSNSSPESAVGAIDRSEDDDHAEAPGHSVLKSDPAGEVYGLLTGGPDLKPTGSPPHRSIAADDAQVFQNGPNGKADGLLTGGPDLKPDSFIREDWTLLRSASTWPQKAGVSLAEGQMLVVNELVANAFDKSGDCSYGRMEGGWIYVQNPGDGIDGTDEQIGELFSIRRPLTSSKLLRLPMRGAGGNGLRVVAGAVLSSGGGLVVRTSGRALRLIPRDDGCTDVERIGPWEQPGTRIEIRLGEAFASDGNPFSWVSTAKAMAAGEYYRSKNSLHPKSSPHWYHSDSGFELFQAAGDQPVRELVSKLDGCSGPKAGKVAAAFLNRTCASLTRAEVESLLEEARRHVNPVKAERLGKVGPVDGFQAHVKRVGEFTLSPGRGRLSATLPFVIEVWAKESSDSDVVLHVNRARAAADISVWRRKVKKVDGDHVISGAGLHHAFTVGRDLECAFWINIITPYMPITSDGKDPDLAVIWRELMECLQAAARQARRRRGGDTEQSASKKWTVKRAAYAVTEASYRKASGTTGLAQARQVMYAARDDIQRMSGRMLGDDYFTQRLLPDFIKEHPELTADWDVVFDARGHLHEPHTGEVVPLGTIRVRQYLGAIASHDGPEPLSAVRLDTAFPTRGSIYRYKAILFIEKEGFLPLFQQVRLAERYDIAIMSSKGLSTTAGRKLVDEICGKGRVPLLVLHDFDKSGFSIFGTLRRNTRRYEFSNEIPIVDLGLRLKDIKRKKWGLKSEEFDCPDTEEARENLRENGATEAEIEFILGNGTGRGQRVELNELTSDDLIKFIEEKLDKLISKVIPDEAVLREAFQRAAAVNIVNSKLEQVVADAMRMAEALAVPPDLRLRVTKRLETHRAESWDQVVAAEAAPPKRAAKSAKKTRDE